MPYFKHRSNPEAVLNKARDTVKLGDHEDAWNIISEYLSSRNKRGWRQAADDMMQVFVELCVQLRKSPKDGFIQYRHHCSTLHLDSLERNLRLLVDLAQQRGEKDYKELLEEFEDQDMTLPAVKKEFSKRQFGLPYLKYQWSVYRCVLDVLRNNQKLDPLYQETVRCAIRFCVAHERTSEYRKLCDVCRKHLNWIFEHQTPGKNYVEIGTQCILSIYLNTRFELLENATKLQLWQEAYRLITDIHILRQRSDATLDPALEKSYYQKLSQIFIGSDNMVLHAYSLIRSFVIQRDEFEREEAGEVIKRKKGEDAPTEDDIKSLAMMCLLSVCATPPPRCRSQTIGPPLNFSEDKFRLMCDKLNFYARPNQHNLIKQLEQEDIYDLLNENFSRIRQIMLENHSPLNLCSEVVRVMDAIIDANPELDVYMEPMKKAAARKLVISVSQMYKVITFERLQQMFFEGWQQSDVEKLLLEMTEEGSIWCRLSHMHGTCNFRAPDRLSRNTFMRTYFSKLSSTVAAMKVSELRNEPDLRHSFFDKVRSLTTEDEKIVAGRIVTVEEQRKKHDHTERFKNYLKHQKRIHEKKAKIDEREAKKAELAMKKQMQAKSKEKENQAAEAAAMAKNQAKRQLRIVSKLSKTKVKARTKDVTKKLQQILNADTEDTSKAAIDAIAVEYLTQNKEAQEAEYQEYLKRFDYFVRACRLEEIPLLKKKIAEDAANHMEDQLEAYTEHVAETRAEYDAQLELKRVFLIMQAHTDYFKEKFFSRREEEFQRSKAIQLEEKAKHDQARADMKRKIEEKKKAQQEINRLEKEKLMRQEEEQRKLESRNSLTASPVMVPRPQDLPKEAPRPADANKMGPPRWSTNGMPVRAAAPQRSEPPSRPAEPTENDNWRVATNKRSRTGPPRFTNSRKKEMETAPPVENKEPSRLIRPPANTVERPSGRTQIVKSNKKGGWRERQRMKEQGVIDPAAEALKRVRPESPASSSSSRSPHSIRPQAPPQRSIRPVERPMSNNVRPVRGPAPVRPASNSRFRPAAPSSESRFRGRPSAPNPAPGPSRMASRDADSLRAPGRPAYRPPNARPNSMRPSQPSLRPTGSMQPQRQSSSQRPLRPGSMPPQRQSLRPTGSRLPQRQNVRPAPQRPPPIRSSRMADRNTNNQNEDSNSPEFQIVQNRRRGKRFMNSSRQN